MSVTARTAAVSLLLCLGFVLSCAPAKPVPAPLVPDAVTPDHLIRRISYDRIEALSAMARIRMERGEDFAASMKGPVNFRRPSSFATSLFGPFGVTLMRLLIADGAVEVLIPKENTLYASVANIPSLLPDSSSLLAQDHDLSENEADFVLTLYGNHEGERVVASRYFFRKDTLVTHRIEKYNASSIFLTILIDETGEERLPTRFTVLVGDTRFIVSLEDIRVNVALPEGAFAHLEADRILPLQELRRAFAPHQ